MTYNVVDMARNGDYDGHIEWLQKISLIDLMAIRDEVEGMLLESGEYTRGNISTLRFWPLLKLVVRMQNNSFQREQEDHEHE